MKKLSSKIIIYLLLATFLWGGVGVGINKTFSADYKWPAGTTITKLDNGFFVVRGIPGSYPIQVTRDPTSPYGIMNYQTEEEYAGVYGKYDPSSSSYNPNNDRGISDPNTEAGSRRQQEEEGKGFWAWLTELGTSLITGPVGKTVMMVNGLIMQAIAIPVMSAVFRISAALIDMSLTFTLSTEMITSNNSAITVVWSLVRNFLNISFIFVLLWISIKTIIGLSSGKTKKILADVIIAALLINFSLFITRIVVDAGNLVAVNLYNKITTFSPGAGLGSILMDNIGLSGFQNIKDAASASGVFSVSFGVISYIQLVLLVMASGSFFYIFSLLLARIVAIIFLMATSPIGFVGSILPQLSEYSDRWKKELYGQTMLAPVLLLFIYLIIMIGKTLTKTTNEIIDKASWRDLLIGDGTIDYTAYFKYFLIIGLLITAVKTTKRLSGEIGSFADKIIKAILSTAAIVLTGGVAIGAGSAKLGFGGAVKSLITGDLGKKRGFTGLSARYARDTFMSQTKKNTFGKVDLKKLETDYKKSRKDEIERIMKEAEAVGPKKAIETHKQLTDTKNNINQQISNKNPELVKNGQKILDLQEQLKFAEERIDKAMEERASTTDSEKIKVIDERIDRFTKEKDVIKSLLDTTPQVDLDLARELRTEQERIAKDMGTTIDQLNDGLKKATESILVGMDNKNKYAAELGSGGLISTGLTKKEREKTVNNIRAMRDKFTSESDLQNNLKKALKDSGFKLDDD